MAQGAPVPPPDFTTNTCNQLKVALKNVVEQKSGPSNAQGLINQLVENVSQLPAVNVADILRFIIFPFGTLALDHMDMVRHNLMSSTFVKS